MDIEQTLCDMSGILESARMTVAECMAENTASKQRCMAFENAYNEEHRTRFECAQAYASLFAQHQMTVNDLQAMDNKYQCLDQELRNSREAAHCRESEVQKCQQALQDRVLSN